MIAVSSQQMNDRQNKLQSLPSLASLFLTHTETPPATPDMMSRGIEGELKQRFFEISPTGNRAHPAPVHCCAFTQ